MTQELWDYIVIGTGMGGSTIGHALAKSGAKVLFCEQGLDYTQTKPNSAGSFPESNPEYQSATGEVKKRLLAQAGRFSEPIIDISGKRPKQLNVLLGQGTGGSTALYGMVLERFFATDFSSHWPIQYSDLEPFYIQAERAFGVHGQPDPLKKHCRFEYDDPREMHPSHHKLFTHLQKQTLHPYQLPIACTKREPCQYCQGYLCAQNCRNDAAKVYLEPAIRKYHATLFSSCQILKLEADQNTVQNVVAKHGEELIHLKAKVVILAAGALNSPRLLLQSANSHWPKGLANNSGLVGRYLMRHLVDLYAIHEADPVKAKKEIGFNDLYLESRLGTVQSFGSLPPAAVIIQGLRENWRVNSPWLGRAFSLVSPFLTMYLRRLFSASSLMATIMEDLPQLENRVQLNSDRLLLHYQISPEDQKRLKYLRAEMANILFPYKFTCLKMAAKNEMLAHACGTCRFGNDPHLSVLNNFNRAHDVNNLYVVDSSFFPTSSGTNPALTIAANALRVAEHLVKQRSDRHGS